MLDSIREGGPVSEISGMVATDRRGRWVGGGGVITKVDIVIYVSTSDESGKGVKTYLANTNAQ